MRATHNVKSPVAPVRPATSCPLRQYRALTSNVFRMPPQILKKTMSVSAVNEVEPISATEAKIDPRAAQSNLHRGPRLPGDKRSLALHIAYVGTSFQGGWTQGEPLPSGMLPIETHLWHTRSTPVYATVRPYPPFTPWSNFQ